MCVHRRFVRLCNCIGQWDSEWGWGEGGRGRMWWVGRDDREMNGRDCWVVENWMRLSLSATNCTICTIAPLYCVAQLYVELPITDCWLFFVPWHWVASALDVRNSSSSSRSGDDCCCWRQRAPPIYSHLSGRQRMRGVMTAARACRCVIDGGRASTLLPSPSSILPSPTFLASLRNVTS